MSDSDSLEKTPEKEDVKSGPGPGSDGSKVRKDLFQKTREGRKKETIRSLRNAFLDVGQDEVDPRWEPVLAELTSLVASCSFNEEELKWKPLPPIDSALSRKEKEEELKKRRYSGALTECLSDLQGVDKSLGEDWIEAVEKALKWKEMRSHRKYYTYVLVDPRSHGPNGPEQTDFEAFIRGVFYIGKGCGNRCASHFFKEEPKGKCQNCSKTVDLDDDMKTIVHKCCKSPKFNSNSLCTTCNNKKADEEESSPHQCCGSGKYPGMAFQTCPHCEKRTSVVDGMFSAHDEEEVCKGSISQPTKGIKCEVCNYKVFPLKDGKIGEHLCLGSSLPPKEGKCKVCKDEALPLKDGKIGKHACPGSSLPPLKGKCKVCKSEASLLKDGKIGKHLCLGSSLPPKEGPCVACEYCPFAFKDGKIGKHACPGSSLPPKKGVCNSCGELNELYLVNNPGPVKGLLKSHNVMEKCEGSGKAVEEGRNAIKDEKMKSIWEAGETPTAVVCTQGEENDEAKDKEAMMIIAYGTCNISKEDRNIEDYKQGKLVNKMSGTETRIKTLNDSAKEGCGLNLLIQAWKNYQSNGKPRCIAQIKWPSNPIEVKSSS